MLWWELTCKSVMREIDDVQLEKLKIFSGSFITLQNLLDCKIRTFNSCRVPNQRVRKYQRFGCLQDQEILALYNWSIISELSLGIDCGDCGSSQSFSALFHLWEFEECFCEICFLVLILISDYWNCPSWKLLWDKSRIEIIQIAYDWWTPVSFLFESR